MKTPYFELGNLKLNYEYTLTEFDNIPLLFVCADQDNKYLCLCNSINTIYRWIVARSAIDTLKKLIEQKISIYEAFKESGGPYYVLIEKNTEEINFYETDFEKLKIDNELPEATLMIDDELLDDDVKTQIINLTDKKIERYEFSYLYECNRFSPRLLGEEYFQPDYGSKEQVTLEKIEDLNLQLEYGSVLITGHNKIFNEFAA